MGRFQLAKQVLLYLSIRNNGTQSGIKDRSLALSLAFCQWLIYISTHEYVSWYKHTMQYRELGNVHDDESDLFKFTSKLHVKATVLNFTTARSVGCFLVYANSFP